MFASGWLANVLAAARVPLMAWGTTIAMPHAAGAIEFEKVALPGRAGDVALDGYLARPAGLATERKVPAVVGLHGCGGLLNAKGQMRPRERDWAERWTKAGYAVLLVDSFNPRGVSSVCATPFDQRTVKTGLRSHDAGWAAAWLVRQPFIDPARLALVGWSHGGSTALLVARSRTRSEANWARYRHIIAFYPGCSSAANRAASGKR